MLIFGVILSVTMSRGWTQEAPTTGCAVALTTPIALPHVLPKFEIDEFVTELTTRVKTRGANAESFAIIEARAEPFVQNVAVFLQTRANYPTVFDQNEASEFAMQAYDELLARVKQLRELRQKQRTAQFWAKLWSGSRPATDLGPTILQTRYLHHGLLKLSEDLRQSTTMTANVLEITQSLSDSVRGLREALTRVTNELEASDADPELLRRTTTLSDDVGMQLHILQNLCVHLDQRIKLDALTQERIRRLLKVVLPLEATLGPADQDLSPLEPPDPTVAQLAPPEPTEVTGGRDRLSVADVLAFASKTKTWNDHEDILENYVKKNRRVLTPAEVVKLAKSSTCKKTLHRFRDRLCMTILEAQHQTLSVNDVIVLAEGTGTQNVNDDVLLFFARKHNQRLSAKDLGKLSGYILMDQNRAAFLELCQ